MNESFYEEMARYKEFRERLNYIHYKKKNYIESLLDSQNFIERLSADGATVQYNYWLCHNVRAKAYLQLGNVTEALKHAKRSNWYTKDGSVERIDTLEVLARCYSTSDLDLSLKCLDRCYELYEAMYHKRGMARVLNNKAQRVKSAEIMLEAVKIFDELYEEGKFSIEDISHVYANLCQIYIDKKQEGRAKAYIHKIKNPTLYNQIKQQLEIMYAQQNVVCI